MKVNSAALSLMVAWLSTQGAAGQTDSLSLSSGNTTSIGTASLNLSLTSPPGSEPAGLQWTFTYPPGNVLSITATAAPTLTNTGKTLSCLAGSGTYTCLATGINTATIANGIVGVVNVTIAPGVNSTSVGAINSAASSASGTAIAISATGGVVTGPGGPALTSLSCTPATVNTGSSITCTINLSGAAPPGGTTVSLASSNALLPVPGGSVTVPATAASTTFTVTAGTITSDQNAILTATLGGISRAATLSLVAPVMLSSLACNPLNLNSGGAMTCTVTLNKSAPAGGTAVSLSSSNVLLPVPASSMTVPATATSTTFTATAGTISLAQSAIITATLNGVSQTATISLVAPVVLSFLACNPNKLKSGSTANCIVTLSGVVPAGGNGMVVKLSSDNTLLPVPPSLIVTAGTSSAAFPATAGTIGKAQVAKLNASLNGKNAPSFVDLVSPRRGGSLTDVSNVFCAPRVVRAGGQVTCELQVASASVGTPIQLASSSDQVKVPSTVNTRPNQSSLTFQALVLPAAKQHSAIITAKLGDIQFEDAILVLPSDGPVMRTPGKQFARTGEPVSFTVDAVDPADLPVQLAVTGLPAGASFDPITGRFTWVPGRLQTGEYTMIFSAYNSAQQSSVTEVSVEVDRGVPVLSSLATSCSPNSVAILNGKWLSASERAVSEPSGKVFELGGTRVKVNGEAVPVLFSSTSQVNFLCPKLAPGDPMSLTLETSGGSSQHLRTMMQEAAPRILSLDGSAQQQGLISFLETGDLVMQRNYRVLAHPAQPGDQILIWATGLGALAESWPGRVVVKIGDLYAAIHAVNAVSGYAGLYAIQVEVPASSNVGDAIAVQLHMSTSDGRQVSSNNVTTTIEPVRQ